MEWLFLPYLWLIIMMISYDGLLVAIIVKYIQCWNSVYISIICHFYTRNAHALIIYIEFIFHLVMHAFT